MEILEHFDNFKIDCEHYDSDGIVHTCDHPDVDGQCLASSCPFIRLASMDDLKEKDLSLYKEFKEDFAEELARCDDERELLPYDIGYDWVIVNE